MKNHFVLVGSVLAGFVVVGLIVVMPGCRKINVEARHQIVMLDGCQYVTVENSLPVGNNYSFAITHKGNCTNAVHKLPCL